jgi:AcrR family transcriptional regulator
MLYAVKAMPRPRSLNHDQIAEAAVAVIDREGLAAMTMRTVAHELGMSTMSLYRYVSGRDELETLVGEAVLATVDDRPPPPGPWRDRVTAMVERVRAAAACHPGAIPLAVAHRPASPASRRWSTTMLDVLAEAGFGAAGLSAGEVGAGPGEAGFGAGLSAGEVGAGPGEAGFGAGVIAGEAETGPGAAGIGPGAAGSGVGEAGAGPGGAGAGSGAGDTGFGGAALHAILSYLTGAIQLGASDADFDAGLRIVLDGVDNRARHPV